MSNKIRSLFPAFFFIFLFTHPIYAAEKLQKILILPPFISVGSNVDAQVMDVLVASYFSQAGYHVLKRRMLADKLCKNIPGREIANLSYLDMDLKKTMLETKIFTNAIVDCHGDMLGLPGYVQSRLLLVRVLLDLKDLENAFELAGKILLDNSNLALDAADWPPEMLFVWSQVTQKMKGEIKGAPDITRMAELGKKAGAKWVVWPGFKQSGAGKGNFLFVVVQTGKPGASSSLVKVDSVNQLAFSVNTALKKKFPNLNKSNLTFKKPGKKKWYKTWWFWTAVATVTTAGTIGIIAGAAGNNDGTTIIHSDVW